MILLPAYGRKYKTAEEAKRDWDADKDFILTDGSGRYINQQDAIDIKEPIYLEYGASALIRVQ